MSDVADRLRKLADAATPGPWRVEPPDEYVGDGDPEGGWVAPHGAYSLNADDNTLIALAPELARGYADALDALAQISQEGRSRPLASAGKCGAIARVALAAAARLFPEDEA